MDQNNQQQHQPQPQQHNNSNNNNNNNNNHNDNNIIPNPPVTSLASQIYHVSIDWVIKYMVQGFAATLGGMVGIYIVNGVVNYIAPGTNTTNTTTLSTQTSNNNINNHTNNSNYRSQTNANSSAR